MRARVEVMPKADVLDPQGRAVEHALHSLGYRAARDVRIGRVVVLELGDASSREEATAQVRDMCERLLANTVIEDYAFEIEE